MASLLKNYYNDDNTDIGLECYWQIINRKLFIEITETNSVGDWFLHILGAVIPKKYNGLWFHRYWLVQAGSLFCFLDKFDFDSFEIRGYSHGGATGIILYYMLTLYKKVSGKIRTYGAPRPTMFERIAYQNFDQLHFKNKGDIVPSLALWFKSNQNTILNKKWQNFISAHMDYIWRFIAEELEVE